MPHPLELQPDQLARHCAIDTFAFTTTADLPQTGDIIGQPRGIQAIEFGIDINRRGYNIYVMGAQGTGRLTAIERFIRARAADDPTPDDVVYVHNFEQPHQPRVIIFPAGQGGVFSEDIKTLIERLQAEMTRVFEAQQFNEAVQALKREFQEKRDAVFKQAQDAAKEKDFVIRSTSGGMVLAPLKDGQVMTTDDYELIDDKGREKIEQQRHELEDQLAEALREAAELEEIAKDAYQRLVEETAYAILDREFAALKEKFAEDEAIADYLSDMRDDIVDHIDDFTSEETEEPDLFGSMNKSSEATGDVIGLERYSVNLLVDHKDSKGAPVVVVDLPTYQHLIGRVEHRVQYGALSTDFTMLKPGALHQANGGFLVVRAIDILSQPFAWEALKRALNTEEICIEEPESRGTSVITTQQLEPEPVPLDVKVIMVGNPMIYYLLFNNEEDFPELFKVKADFTATMDRSSETEMQYAHFIASRCHEEGIPHFSPEAAGRIVDYGAWLADDQNKLSTRFGALTDLIGEAGYFAQKADRDQTLPEDVARAIDARRYRSNLYEELTQEEIIEGTVIIDTDGEVVGQVNGLTVLQLGDYMFGQPSRITARVFVGQSGVVQIEREVEMSGPIHDKGVLTLRGYLGSRYAQDFPLSLTASLTFEQNYGGIEGDSASSTELYALLSALSGFAVRQDLAVTGSVDQRGAIQPIGGATEKIEGFFRICKERGLTGTQGVIIPQTNVRHLMLDQDVLDAVEAGQFHIYAIASIEQGIELLLGKPAGEAQPDGSYPDGTVHHAVAARLRQMAENLRQFSAPVVQIQGKA